MATEIEESLRRLLITFDAVTAIVGSGSAARIRPDRLHESDTLPAVVIEVDDEDHANDLDGLGGLVHAAVNVKCRAATKSRARALAAAVARNGTSPGTGLAGYSGAAGDQTIDGILEHETTSYHDDDDGDDQGYYDVDCEYTCIFQDAT